MGGGRSSSSSSEEDGDAEWRAAIDSVATTTTFTTTTLKPHSSLTPTNDQSVSHLSQQNNIVDTIQPQNLKHYQIKAQKALEDILDKTIEIVGDINHASQEDLPISGGGVRLFKRAPPGIVFDYTDELQQPRKKPRIHPGKEIEEKSKEFKCQIKSVAVEGMDVLAASKNARQKLLARLEAKEAAAKAAAKREEERVAALRRIRGERWLPSVAKEMQLKLRQR